MSDEPIDEVDFEIDDQRRPGGRIITTCTPQMFNPANLGREKHALGLFDALQANRRPRCISLTLIDYNQQDLIDTGPVLGVTQQVEIEFGHDGGLARVVADFGRGSTVAIPGSYCRVNGIVDNQSGAPLAAPRRLGVSMGEGVVPGGDLYVYQRFLAVAAAAAATPIIPPYATHVKIATRQANAISVRFLNTTTFWFSNYTGSASANQFWIPVPSFANTMDVTNNGAVATDIYVLFRLGFGVTLGA